MKLFEVETDDIGTFKTVIEILNNIVHEVNAVFCKNVKKVKVDDNKTINTDDEENTGQIRIFTTDPNKVMLIYVVLNGYAFKKFIVHQKDCSIGINIDELTKFIKHIDKDGIMKMHVDCNNAQHIEFEVKSANNAPDSICQLRIVDVRHEQPAVTIHTDVNLYIRIGCDIFHKVCKNLHQFSQFIEITCDTTQLTITCKGDVSNHKRIFRDDGTKDSIKITVANNKQDKNNVANIVRLVFDLKYINFMNKTKDLCDDMLIKLSDTCMFLEYNIKLMGKMVIGISPSVKKKEHAENYNESNNAYYKEEEVELI